MVNEILNRVTAFFRKNILLDALLLASLGLTFLLRQPLGHFPMYVDWQTIITLSGLLIITSAIKESGFFYFLAYRISRKIDNERILAVFLILLSALLSMFLTNDIALFIVVPLTVSLQDISAKDFTKLIVFEAIAVNVGSALTPIGNPQNIFLWHKWGLSFPVFVKEMAPLVLLLLILLLVLTCLAFPSRKINPNHKRLPAVKNNLFVTSAVLLALFALSVELKADLYLLSLIVVIFLLFYRKVLLKADWGLVLLFIFIFIDVRLLSGLPPLQNLFDTLNLHQAKTLFFTGAFLSQAISNVPATVLLSHFTTDYKMMAYAVNVGGNGLLIASFANLIAMNFIKGKAKYVLFHIYSVSFFVASLILVWLLFL